MGWGDCGNDSTGRPIGYLFNATCDKPGCNAKIDRGLSFACGDMHGEAPGCEKYFCQDHLEYVEVKDMPEVHQLCAECKELYRKDGELVEEEDDA